MTVVVLGSVIASSSDRKSLHTHDMFIAARNFQAACCLALLRLRTLAIRLDLVPHALPSRKNT